MTRWLPRISMVAVAAVACSLLAAESPSYAASSCVISATGQRGIIVNGLCLPHHSRGGSTNVPPTRIIICGRPSSDDNALWNSRCGTPRTCYQTTNGRVNRKIIIDAYATLVEQNGTWVLQSVWCPATNTPIPTTQALRQQVLRLLPTVAVGMAWKDTALVNAETVLWAATDSNRSLGTVTVVGRPVGLRIGFDHANWDFGDGATDTASTPGKPYTDADPCHTSQCADYYGHTYRETGDETITLTVAWHADFSLDGGRTWADVDQAPLTGPPATRNLTVEQARGILVPDP